MAVEAARPEAVVSGRFGGRPAPKPRWWEGYDPAIDAVDLGLATSTVDLESAFRLVHDQYVWRGYMSPRPSGLRFSLYNALPTTKVFVAKREDRVIGTLTLIEDSELGLPMDDIYRQELAGLRGLGQRIAEVSALAIEGHRRMGLPLLMRLVRMLVLYALEVATLDHLCIAVNPRHVEFYERAFLFRRCGDVKRYRTVNGAPAVALVLDLGMARFIMAEAAAGVEDDFSAFMFGAGMEAVLRRIRNDVGDSTLTSEQFRYFFVQHGVVASAPPSARTMLQALYADVLAAEASRNRTLPVASSAPARRLSAIA